MPADILDGYIDLDPLAAELGRNPRTIMRWTEQPDGLPFVRLGRRILFKRESVREWIAAREHKPNPRRAVRRRAAAADHALRNLRGASS
jgi:excisionase family DNA binding protein